MNDYKLPYSSIQTFLNKQCSWKENNKFIKTSTIIKNNGAIRFMYDSYAEYIVHMICNYFEVPSIPYGLCKVHTDSSLSGQNYTVASVSENFRRHGENFYSFARLMQLNEIDTYVLGDKEAYNGLVREFSTGYGVENGWSAVENFRYHLDRILFIDSLVLNVNRHFGNFGIMVDDEGNTRVSPMFDNGQSLLCNIPLSEIDISKIESIKCRPFCSSFNEQLSLIDPSNIDFGVDKIVGLQDYVEKELEMLKARFELPDDRAESILTIIKHRIKVILG